MDGLLAARTQMAFSLAFHMLFAAAGVGMPLLTVAAEGLWLLRRQPHYLALARAWTKATTVLFAVGAVSGTVLSFQMGLLWPGFMERFGATIGPAFTLEGFAFFLEAIALGLYAYGWRRLPPLAHWAAGLAVAVSAAASSVLVTASNAWMQNPYGLADGLAARQPLRALFANPVWPVMALHSTLATYAATGFAVAGVYAWKALRGQRGPEVRSALNLAMAAAALASLAMPITGDLSARTVARHQPAKLAAMEAQFVTESGAPLRILGLVDVRERQVRGALEIPGALSWLVHRDARAEVAGLDRVPEDQWPNVALTRWAFQAMVGAGVAMLGVCALYGAAAWRAAAPSWRERLMWRSRPRWRAARGLDFSPMASRPLMLALVASAPLGYVALEAGWVVAEVGRQPWIVYGVMRTEQAVTPAGGLWATLAALAVLYVALGLAVVAVLRRPDPMPGPQGTTPEGKPVAAARLHPGEALPGEVEAR